MKAESFLKGHELFRSLNVKDADQLSNASSTKEFHGGETIFQCGAPSSHVYMLISGDVHLMLPAEKNSPGIVLAKVGRGELFGISPLLQSSRYTTTAMSVGDSQVLAIEARVLREVLGRNSTVAIDVLNKVARIYFERYLELVKDLQGVVNQIPFAH